MSIFNIEEDRAVKLCAGFFRLDGREQERILGMVEALDFAKNKISAGARGIRLAGGNGGEATGITAPRARR